MQSKHWLMIPSIPIVIALSLLWYFSRDYKSNQLPVNSSIMQLTSTAFAANGLIPAKFTCDGANISPELKISGVPSGAKSLVLIMDDPDISEAGAKRLGTSTFDHWVRFNIPAETKEIKEGEEPLGTVGRGTMGDIGYQGPCPPDQEHRYFFKLYALDSVLDLPEGSNKLEVETAMVGHIIEQAELIGRYNRPQNK